MSDSVPNRHRTDCSAHPAPVESITVGDIRITYLPDGEGHLSPGVVFPASAEALWSAHPEYLDDDRKVLVSVGGFLIETGGENIVVDTGLGDMTVPSPEVDGLFTGGRFLHSLRQAGVDPAAVSTVIYTHLHVDHVGWTAQQGALTFSNAWHLAGPGEWDFWRTVDHETAATIGPHPEAVQGPLENRMEAVSDGQTVAPGVNIIATPGHTPGHISLAISSGTERAVILGDVLHCPLQLEETQLEIIFDTDPAVARQTRMRIARELESPQTLMAGSHFANSVFGRVVPGRGRRWVAVG